MRVCRCSSLTRRFTLSPCCTNLRLRLCRRLLLIYQIFCYNSDDSINLRIDTLLQPVFSLTDRLAKYLGKLFICFFLLIISTAVYIFYTSVFVHFYTDVIADRSNGQHSYFSFCFHLIFGHWLLINIMFNYVQAVRVDPGSSPNFGYAKPYNFDKADRDAIKAHRANIDKNNNPSNNVTIIDLAQENSNDNQIQAHNRLPASVTQLTSTSTTGRQLFCQNVCRKCILPKPARAHHCSVCSRCILNQDHHCPWINNCVGHLNHRYFFQFCFFMTLGSFYAATFGFAEFQHYIFGRKVFSYLDLILGRRLNEVEFLPHITDRSTHYTFMYLFIVSISACLVLCGFTVWHFWLVSRAETTIEFHVNSTEKARLKELHQQFVNPYNLGFKANWQMFLGLHRWYQIFYKNLLPSTHVPFCDGINWPVRKPTTITFDRNQKLNKPNQSKMFDV